MKKRGVNKVKVSRRNTAKKIGSKDEKSPKIASRPKRNARSKLSSESFIRKEERIIEKEVKRDVHFLVSPHEFHVVTFVISLMVLSFLFASLSLVFYAVLTIAALAFAHFLKQHHRPHDVLTIIGVFFLPLAFTIAAFRDTLTLLLLGVYLVSVISTVVIYYVHKKVHTPLKIMWQVTYSRIVAVTLALVFACLVPFILPDAFLSIFEIIFIAVLPVAFIFFFMSKFLYLYFFDRKHILSDILKSLRHTIIYTLVFVVLLMCIYSIFAAGLYTSKSAGYSDNLDVALIGVTNVEKTMLSLPEDLSDTMVAKDVAGFASSVGDEISQAISDADSRRLSFAELVDDSYFRILSDNIINIVRFVVLQKEASSMKSDLLEGYYSFSEAQGEDEVLEMYSSSLKSYVEGNFVPVSQDPDVQEVLASLNDPDETYSYFEDNGFLYWFSDAAELSQVYGSGSILGRQMSILFRHSELFRQLSRIVLNLVVMIDNEAVSPSAVEYIYANRESDITPLSSALRYTLIKQSMDERKEKVAEANRVTFKVE